MSSEYLSTQTTPSLRQRVTLMRMLVIAAWSMTLLFVATPLTSSAQPLDGVDITFYGYISPNVTKVLTLGHLQADDPSLAAELVSPQYADDFFGSFTQFTDYEFAADLDPQYLDRIDEADEYMVFKGMLDSVDGIKPGYLMFLSTSQQVFVIFGYQDAAEDLFHLAGQTIQASAVPQTYADFNRVDLADDGDIDSAATGLAQPIPKPQPAPTRTPRPAPTQAPANASSRSQDQTTAVFRDPYSYVGEEVVVSGEVFVIAQDTDGTTYIVLADQRGGTLSGFLIAYPGAVPGVGEGDRISVTGVVVGVEDLEGDLLPLIVASDIN